MKAITTTIATTGLTSRAAASGLRSRQVTATAVAVALVAFVAWLDFLSGDFSMAVFYLLPVAIASWVAGRRVGIAIAVLSAAGQLADDLATTHAGDSRVLPYWNGAVFAATYGIVAHFVSALQRLQSELEDRIERRTASPARANAELEAARMRLIEAAKLETIGRLAAGVAHEVKNPLMTITMAADYLARIIPPSAADAPAMIQDLRDAVGRANRVISELLEFARPGVLTLAPEDLSAVAERALSLVRLELARRHLTVVREWVDPSPRLRLDRNRIEQVLINVLVNAIHASPEGGTITLRTRIDGDHVIVEIDDTGPGITPAHQARLFEPFFTTKPPGQGTGLGLSVARQIVQLHGGTFAIANRPTGGARVTIDFPPTIRA